MFACLLCQSKPEFHISVLNTIYALAGKHFSSAASRAMNVSVRELWIFVVLMSFSLSSRNCVGSTK